jgi:hypothetical protein
MFQGSQILRGVENQGFLSDFEWTLQLQHYCTAKGGTPRFKKWGGISRAKKIS